jgi:glycosyltransferase involved in cell wall biosynthesis
MRIKLLEAMVRGKAIVTTSIGAEGLKNAPGISVANEPKAFAEAIQRLVEDKDYRFAQGAAAQAHARATFADDALVASLRAL